MEIVQQSPKTIEFSTREEHHGGRLVSWRLWKDRAGSVVMGGTAAALCVLTGSIGLVLAVRSWPILSLYPLKELLFSQTWLPMHGQFGFAAFIAGSIAVTLVAMIIAVLPGVFSGIYLAEYTSRRARSVIKPAVDLMVGIPSVVYGLWGILFIVPLIRNRISPFLGDTLGRMIPFFANRNPSGYGLLAGGFVLGIMIFPVIVSVTEEVLRSVPQAMREALLALGTTRWEATRCIVLHRGMPGVVAAIVLGLSRAFGETLAVMMVVGNISQVPRSLFDATYPLTALIANNYGEMMSIPLYEAALMSAALILLVVVLCFNIGARLVITRLTQRK